MGRKEVAGLALAPLRGETARSGFGLRGPRRRLAAVRPTRRRRASPRRMPVTLPELLVAGAVVAAAVAVGMGWVAGRADQVRLADARADAAFLQSALVAMATVPPGLPDEAAVRDYEGLRRALTPRAELPPEEGRSSFRFVRYERTGERSFRLLIRARDADQTKITVTEAEISESVHTQQTQESKRFPWYPFR